MVVYLWWVFIISALYCMSGWIAHWWIMAVEKVILVFWVIYLLMFSSFSVVFMGSEKYPDENSFDMFIKKHGGSDNASTDCERVSWPLYVVYRHQ